MLTFLFLAAKHGFQVDSYEDVAVGSMTKNKKRVPWISSVTLQPEILYSGDIIPTRRDGEHLHHLAHEQCFIAQSVKTAVVIRSR